MTINKRILEILSSATPSNDNSQKSKRKKSAKPNTINITGNTIKISSNRITIVLSGLMLVVALLFASLFFPERLQY